MYCWPPLPFMYIEEEESHFISTQHSFTHLLLLLCLKRCVRVSWTNYWVWSLIIFLISKILFQPGLDPKPQQGGVGGLAPYYCCKGAKEDGNKLLRPPTEGSRATPLKGFFLEKCPIKYCNFVVNLDHSLCHRSDGRSYVNLRFFALKGNPLIYMRELYHDCVLFWERKLWEGEEKVIANVM